MSTQNFMNIKGQCHSLTFVVGHSDSTFSNLFSLETVRPIESKFYMEPPWIEGMKVNTNGCVTWPRWLPCPYMVKPLKILSGPKRLMTLKLGMRHWLLEYYQICSNDDPGLTLTYFKTRSNLDLFFRMGKCLSCRFPRNNWKLVYIVK